MLRNEKIHRKRYDVFHIEMNVQSSCGHLTSLLTCKLAISERPARFHIMLAGGFASASHRNTTESLPSSRSICGTPSNRMVGASKFDYRRECEQKRQRKNH